MSECAGVVVRGQAAGGGLVPARDRRAGEGNRHPDLRRR